MRWRSFEKCQTDLVKVNAKIDKMSQDSKNSINNEFAQNLGVSLVDFAVKWSQMTQAVDEWREDKNAPQSPKNSPKSPEVLEVTLLIQLIEFKNLFKPFLVLARL